MELLPVLLGLMVLGEQRWMTLNVMLKNWTEISVNRLVFGYPSQARRSQPSFYCTVISFNFVTLRKALEYLKANDFVLVIIYDVNNYKRSTPLDLRHTKLTVLFQTESESLTTCSILMEWCFSRHAMSLNYSTGSCAFYSWILVWFRPVPCNKKTIREKTDTFRFSKTQYKYVFPRFVVRWCKTASASTQIACRSRRCDFGIGQLTPHWSLNIRFTCTKMYWTIKLRQTVKIREDSFFFWSLPFSTQAHNRKIIGKFQHIIDKTIYYIFSNTLLIATKQNK